MYTRRSFSATDSQSASATLPPSELVPRNAVTPSRATQHKPAETAASAFRTPSVIHSGTAGLPILARSLGGTSSTIWEPPGVSYLTSFLVPSFFLAWRGPSGRYWWVAMIPVTLWTGISSPGTRRW